jgi:hypothetical protein
MIEHTETKVLSLRDMLDLHTKHGNGLMFEYYMDEYCHRLLQDNAELYKVEVTFPGMESRIYTKPKLKIVR